MLSTCFIRDFGQLAFLGIGILKHFACSKSGRCQTRAGSLPALLYCLLPTAYCILCIVYFLLSTVNHFYMVIFKLKTFCATFVLVTRLIISEE